MKGNGQIPKQKEGISKTFTTERFDDQILIKLYKVDCVEENGVFFPD